MSDTKYPTSIFWMTRDRDPEGNLEPMIDVWVAKPSFKSLPGGKGVMWICEDTASDDGDGGIPARFTQWTVAEALKNCYVYPETERESICVG